MSIFDAIKKSVLEQFSSTVTVPMILLSLVVAFGCAYYIIFIYKKTFSGVVYNKTVALTIIMLAMVTALIIRTINSNLTLSLGMVGALSIVRFRTAIKEPVDTAFLFWAITVGIMSGAGLYLIAIVACLAVGLLYYFIFMLDKKNKSRYLLVINYDESASSIIEEEMSKLKDCNLKSSVSNITKAKKKTPTSAASKRSVNIESVYEVKYNEATQELIRQLQQQDNINSVNIVTYDGDYGL